MCLPGSVSIADLVMEDMEQHALFSYSTICHVWKHYMWMKPALLQALINHFNLIEPSSSLVMEY